MKLYLNKFLYIFILSFICLSCSSLSSFDQTALDQATIIKTISLYLMGNATNPYNDFKPQIEDLKEQLNIAYKYEKGRTNNDESSKQWETLINPNGNLLGGFLSRWQSKNKLSETFINQAKDLVRNGFDEIIDLESSKK